MKSDLNKILNFEKDKNGFPLLTEYNAKLINFLVNNDSNYRNDENSNKYNTTAYWVDKYKENKTRDNLLEIIKAVDRQNSTHLNINDGYNKVCDYIIKKIGFEKLKERIEENDLSLVDEIANNSSDRFIISYASKFCTYMSRYMFNSDNYSIYDGVVSKILPYYYYKYVGNDEIDVITKKDDKIEKKEKIKICDLNITNELIKLNKYEWYKNLIDKVMDHVKISRKDLDYILWYYYKGDKDIEEGGYKSRITLALEKMREDAKKI